MEVAADIVIVGAGAAGLMAGITAGRTGRQLRILALDGAPRIGSKILISGGGRCNVTNSEVSEKDFCGSTQPAIRKVLRRFGVKDTIDFFRELGVKLKCEESGRLFPVSNRAQTVLDALLSAAHAAGVEIRTAHRVERVRKSGGMFCIEGSFGRLECRRVLLCTGGRSVPKTGSDGHGYSLAKALGHSLTPHIFPALAPLLLPRDHFLCGLSGISVPVALQLRSGTGRLQKQVRGSLLCAHFGISGPAVLDMSRHFIEAGFADPDATVFVNWLPERSVENVDRELRELQRKSPATLLRSWMPQRLAEALCDASGVEASAPGYKLDRSGRRNLVETLTQMRLPVTGNRGFAVAEATAGGIPLNEVRLDTMESRVCPGLFLCGEICDVDGRIGGFNFQWAWSSGAVAGAGAAKPGLPD